MTWEEAVRWYREQPGNEAEIRNNYFDLPVLRAAERYARSEEFAEVLRLLGPGEGREILDLGAGNGIASFALAKNGWRVTALEPDPSDEVGAGAIRSLAKDSKLSITVVQQAAEELPFQDDAFDAIHARQVLHHAANLPNVVSELARVLKSSCLLLVTREHVADNDRQMKAFRASHPLHHLYGGESAHPLSLYMSVFDAAGLQLLKHWGPFESILNFYPGTEQERLRTLRQIANRSWLRLGRLLAWSSSFRARQVAKYTLHDETPGRIYSFLLNKT